jgi:hypothetical protein
MCERGTKCCTVQHKAAALSRTATTEFPVNHDRDEVLKVARGLLSALSGPYPHAAASEFSQLGPQVMRDLVELASSSPVSDPPVVTGEEKEIK